MPMPTQACGQDAGSYPTMFEVIAHADWSIAAAKRWVVWARRSIGGWHVERPRPVLDAAALLLELRDAAAGKSVLAGFDFPIGLPAAYGEATGFADALTALPAFGAAQGWENFYRVSSLIDDVGPHRPFFPRRAIRGMRRADLWQRLGLAHDAALFRLCERAGGPGLRQACPLFWTVGANQVGRATAEGWQEVIVPALGAGARVWPYHGRLDKLAAYDGLVLAETYPADAYARLGAAFGHRASKRRQTDRADRAGAIMAWAEGARVDLSACCDDLMGGFGPSATGEDRFDAFVGALGMIAVADGGIPAIPDELPKACMTWEGWILGRPRPAPSGRDASGSSIRGCD